MSAARWEMDLSPGKVIRPVIFRAGGSFMFSFLFLLLVDPALFQVWKKNKDRTTAQSFPVAYGRNSGGIYVIYITSLLAGLAGKVENPPLQSTGYKVGNSMWNSVSTALYPSVLIAEDSRDTRIMLKRAFELKGYSVIEAADGNEALEVINHHRPSLIVIDLNMPVVDGLEAIKEIRRLEAPGEHVPIVAITAFDVYGMKEAALETGCNTYLSKPLDMEELDRALKGLGFIV